jgi:rhamnosyltransferase
MQEGVPVRTFACIVTYEPELQLLTENLRSIVPQVEGVVVVDNNSSNAAEIADDLPDGVMFHRLPANRGLSAAMNIAVRRAMEAEASAVVMLDQDSVVGPTLVRTLQDDLDEDPGLAVVAPDIQDRNLGHEQPAMTTGLEQVNACITSGSIVRVEDWERVGGWDEDLFIDYVDFDFCLRIRLAGRGIAIDHRAVLDHSIGNARRAGAVVAWGHGAARLEHMAKDVLHYAKKHRGSPTRLQVVPNSLARALAVLIRKTAVIVLHEDDKVAKVSAIARGTIAGLRG